MSKETQNSSSWPECTTLIVLIIAIFFTCALEKYEVFPIRKVEQVESGD